MKMRRDYRPELAVSDDDDRFNLQHPYLDVEHKILVATNGHLLVGVPVEVGEGEKAGHVRAELLDIARRESPYRDEIEVAGGKVEMGEGKHLSWPLPDGLKFPAYRQVIPEFKEDDAGTVTFGVSAKYLMDAARALGCGDSAQIAITLSVEDRTAPVLIRRAYDDRDPKEFAVLMPVTVKAVRWPSEEK